MKWLNYCLQRSLSSLFFRRSADIISKHLHIQQRRNKVWEVWECQQKCSILGQSFNWLILNKYKITRILVIVIEHLCDENILYYVFLKIWSMSSYIFLYIFNFKVVWNSRILNLFIKPYYFLQIFDDPTLQV